MSGTAPEHLTEIVRAGAGTGKTYQLTERVIQVATGFLNQKAQRPRLMITTFTRKATEELRERITAKALKVGQVELIRVIENPKFLHISTIHGVLSLFLRSYGHLLGIESDFSVISEREALSLSKRALRDILKSQPQFVPLAKEHAVKDLLQGCLDYRRLSMSKPSLAPFTEDDHSQAARETLEQQKSQLINVIETILAEVADEKWTVYLNNFLQVLGRSQIDGLSMAELGRKPQFRGEPFSPELNKKFDDLRENLKKLLEREHMSPKLWPNFEHYSRMFSELGQSFTERINKLKCETGRFESDDLELFSLSILRTEPALGQAFAADWDYWFVDEYQDTSPLQVELLNQLIGRAPAFFVGDPQQSIYLFRGARAEVFAQREEKVKNEGGQLGQLMINRRSTPELLEAINTEIKILGPEFSPMQPRSKPQLQKASSIRYFRTDPQSDNPYQEIIRFIIDHLNKGGRPDDFCVLARTNQVLATLAFAFESRGLPCVVHSASGFFSRREVIDLMSLWKFLWNPYDETNLLRLLRSPWVPISDQELARLASKGDEPLWHKCKSDPDQKALEKLRAWQNLARQKGLTEAFRTALLECGVIEASHWHDSTGRRESNLWKLVVWLEQQESQPGFNPTQVHRQFEFALGKFDEESDATASKEPNRINLMTVHKAKGLSFKYVILSNMEKVPRFSSARGHERLLQFDEALAKFSLAIKVDSKTMHGPAAHRALTDLAIREKQESKRLIYVALTRAEDGLLYHALDSGKGLSEDSWAGLLVLQNPNRRMELLEANGDPLPALTGLSVQELPEIPRYESRRIEMVGPRFSVSSLLNRTEQAKRSKIQAGTQATPEKTFGQLAAPSRGTELHAWFELLKFQAKDELLDRIQKESSGEVLEQKQAIEYVLELQDPPLGELIQSGQVEWGFQVRTRIGVLEGQIDLWGLHKDLVWVIDYKSGSQRYSEAAFEQLRIYAWALSKAYGHKAFRLAVVYPFDQVTKTEDFSNLTSIEKQYGL